MGTSFSGSNVQPHQSNGDNNSQQPLERDIVTNDIPIGNQQPFTCSSPTLQVFDANLNGINRDEHLNGGIQTESFPKEQRTDNGRKNQSNLRYVNKSNLSADLFDREIVIVIKDFFNDSVKDMVNSTAQHPKTRNPTKSTVATNSNCSTSSNNSVGSTRDSTDKEHITNETIMTMTTKSSLSTGTPIPEVIINVFICNT